MAKGKLKKVYSNKVARSVIAYAFATGVVLALVLGSISSWLPDRWIPLFTSLLIIAGIIVGFFNINQKESKDYMLFVTALVIVTSLSQGSLTAVQRLGPHLENILSAVLAFVVPSVIVVSLRAVVNMAKN